MYISLHHVQHGYGRGQCCTRPSTVEVLAISGLVPSWVQMQHPSTNPPHHLSESQLSTNMYTPQAGHDPFPHTSHQPTKETKYSCA